MAGQHLSRRDARNRDLSLYFRGQPPVAARTVKRNFICGARGGNCTGWLAWRGDPDETNAGDEPAYATLGVDYHRVGRDTFAPNTSRRHNLRKAPPRYAILRPDTGRGVGQSTRRYHNPGARGGVAYAGQRIWRRDNPGGVYVICRLCGAPNIVRPD